MAKAMPTLTGCPGPRSPGIVASVVRAATDRLTLHHASTTGATGALSRSSPTVQHAWFAWPNASLAVRFTAPAGRGSSGFSANARRHPLRPGCPGRGMRRLATPAERADARRVAGEVVRRLRSDFASLRHPRGLRRSSQTCPTTRISASFRHNFGCVPATDRW